MKSLIKIVSVAFIVALSISTATAQSDKKTEEMLLKKEKRKWKHAYKPTKRSQEKPCVN